MAQQLASCIICDRRLRMHAINAVDRQNARIIEMKRSTLEPTGANFSQAVVQQIAGAPVTLPPLINPG